MDIYARCPKLSGAIRYIQNFKHMKKLKLSKLKFGSEECFRGGS